MAAQHVVGRRRGEDGLPALGPAALRRACPVRTGHQKSGVPNRHSPPPPPAVLLLMLLCVECGTSSSATRTSNGSTTPSAATGPSSRSGAPRVPPSNSSAGPARRGHACHACPPDRERTTRRPCASRRSVDGPPRVSPRRSREIPKSTGIRDSLSVAWSPANPPPTTTTRCGDDTVMRPVAAPAASGSIVSTVSTAGRRRSISSGLPSHFEKSRQRSCSIGCFAAADANVGASSRRRA